MKVWLFVVLALVSACAEVTTPASENRERGEHGGRLLLDGEFELELAIVESGIEPEFRAWARRDDQVLSPEDIDLEVSLERLGGRIDTIEFEAVGDFLRSRSIVAEPHSFSVTVTARQAGTEHRWAYDQFEGRTRIGLDMVATFGVETEQVGPAVIQETISARGRIAENGEKRHVVRARFDGIIRRVEVVVGDRVEAGQILAEVESDDSLNRYNLTAPSSGVVVARDANPGEHSAGRELFRIVDTSSVWVELAVFPRDRSRVVLGLPVVVRSSESQVLGRGEVDWVSVLAEADQTVMVRITLENSQGLLLPGDWVSGEIAIENHTVERAVRRSALQSFRQFTVVFEQIGDEYEVRMLETGRESDEWIEVLGGIESGARYVTTNSYLIKADIEKAGAAHEH